jgi:hypothetical protein
MKNLIAIVEFVFATAFVLLVLHAAIIFIFTV